MIEILDAVEGGKVIRFEGRLLASRFAPVREAREWLASRMDYLKQVKHIVVLGLGSGHHIQQLVKDTTAQILVIELNSEIISATEAWLDFPKDRVKIEHFANARALRASESVKRSVRESFVVLAHPPSLSLNPSLYEECRAQLLGREWGALNWQWNLRNGPGFDANPRIDGGGAPLTIYDLEQTELVQNSEEREKLLLKALRELVK